MSASSYPRRLAAGVLLLVAAVISSTAPAGSGRALPSPELHYGKALVPYGVVHKLGGYHRRMLVDQRSYLSMQQTGTLPADSLFVLETWFGAEQGTVYIRERRAGRWLAGEFAPEAPDFGTTETHACDRCHVEHAQERETVFTRSMLRTAARTRQVVEATCPTRSFVPCPLDTYGGIERRWP